MMETAEKTKNERTAGYKSNLYLQGCITKFRWRGISLYPLLHVKYHWQRVPLLFHYEVVTSLLFIRKHTIYLVVGFQDKTEI